MNFTQDEIMAIVGAKELEIIYLRKYINALQEQVKELTPISASVSSGVCTNS